MKFFKVTFLSICLLQLSGCMQFQQPAIEDYALVQVVTFDYVESTKETKVSVMIPQVITRDKESIKVYEVTDATIAGAINKLSMKIDKTMVPSQLQVGLMSQKYAKEKGLKEVIEFFRYHPTLSMNMMMAITEENAGNIVKGKYKDQPKINDYIISLMVPRFNKSFAAFTNLQEVYYRTSSGTSDPTIPLLIKEDQQLSFNGNVLFRDYKMQHTLGVNKSNILQLLREKRGKLYTVEMDLKGAKRKQIYTRTLKSKVRYISNGDLSHPHVTVKLDIQVGGLTIDSGAPISATEKRINQYIKTEVNQLIAELQKEEVDAIGMGEAFRQTHRGKWSGKNWRQTFPKVRYTTEVTTDVTEGGLSE
ncbi:Ger(x)C family spore germination protein [Peribacillus muralis]|uniref:Ger(x)C family spore germination protein n=1 Tax=Peribacillus muralis TaxID=264697 RepID=UPI001F4E2953|nr:Ger(x)C family spore germination protein [Peribacillus muralis]MCK1992088.1 Ger(x)C family spore germination C-terminal domain-containing protein [Peribacillus muralis]MCK2012644.1 Ger(x)C family spore germination C-terminal domain-containing protein [Peribacillus muralis]